MGVTNWSEEEDDFLRRCVVDRKSAAECEALLEAVFGNGRSRSAVIGRTHRLKIAFNSPHPCNNRADRPAKARRQPKPKAERAPTPQGRPARARVETPREDPVALALELAAQEAAFAEASRDNPGVLFLERDMARQCARPMPGWDAAPIAEKRVCGLPALSRRVVVAGIAVNQPTSWCLACTKLVYSAARRPLDVKALARADRSMRAA